jgi:hypothetical protein
LSESTSRPDAASAYSSGTGPSLKAVPTMRLSSPRARSSSSVDDLIVTTRSGADSKVTSVPQLSSVSG